MKIKYLALALLLFAVNQIDAQEGQPGPFQNGEPIGRVFANYYTGIGQGDNPSAFEVRRAYLGYKFDLDDEFSAQIQLDIGSPDDVSQYSLLRRFAYFKSAYLQYQKGRVNIKFGIIPLQLFKLQESIWNHRYIYKSVLDEHSLGSTADLGASINYKASRSLVLDLTFMNGEGYSQLQADYSYKIGIGFTLRPWKGLIVRCYGDAIQKNENLITLVNFVGWEIKNKLLAGVEYDLRLNDDFETNYDQHVFSGYLSYNITEKFQVFGRYDFITSSVLENQDKPWNLDDDGSAIIAGVQYQPIPKVRLSLNYQDWVPYAQNLNNEAFIYFNVEFRIW
jgi:hypothetical protein